MGKSLMNYRTTIVGAMAGLAVLSTMAGLPQTPDDWFRAIVAVSLAVLGVFAKDGATGSAPGDE